MLRTLIPLILISVSGFSQDVKKLNETNQSVTWEQAIDIYSKLDKKYDQAQLLSAGTTDCGKQLNTFMISASGVSHPIDQRYKEKCVILIMNGIHPGEPDGVDGSIRLAQDLLSGKVKLPENLVIIIIPMYNVDGSLNRSCCSRANQDGPAEYGFRGNCRNLDLNRDFIKCDSENARAFTNFIFRFYDPDIFIDTHVSDGADYPYVMTLISTQHDKLGGEAGKFLKQQMTPALFRGMEKKGIPMVPYVNTLKYDDDPSKGIYGFNESPRFATGYAALYQTFGFVTETHMLKPFPKRVEATVAFLECAIEYASKNASQIKEARRLTRQQMRSSAVSSFNYRVDTTRYEMIPFNGYEVEMRKSPVTGADQLYYNRDKPYSREIKFYDQFAATDSVRRPKYYIVPRAWREVVERLSLNRIIMSPIINDTVIEVECYFIEDYKTQTEPYEGHYLHRNIQTRTERLKLQFYAGDYYIPTEQDAARYVIETLEPRSEDSFFAWGFFDSILQQKEWFSSYIFDGIAAGILEKDPELKKRFEEKKQFDPKFAADSFAQLYYIYKASPYFEKSFKLYPVVRSLN